ncbi:MAG: MerR family transcriptional regulator [Bacillota bacterium]
MVRVYDDEDFLRLQQILTLKFIGLSLDEIKVLLHGREDDLPSLNMDKVPIEFFKGWDSKMIEFMTKTLKIYNNTQQ